MGFFSWKTADTQESIPNVYAEREPVTVFMLQPSGEPSIVEHSYEGNGQFAGMNVHLWLANNNAAALGFDIDALSYGDLILLGIGLECGTVMRDTQTGEYWHIYSDYRAILPGRYVALRYNEVIPELGDSANNLRESGRFESLEIADAVDPPYPLKFSFNKNARYEDLPASERCPDQGFFYDD